MWEYKLSTPNSPLVVYSLTVGVAVFVQESLHGKLERQCIFTVSASDNVYTHYRLQSAISDAK